MKIKHCDHEPYKPSSVTDWDLIRIEDLDVTVKINVCRKCWTVYGDITEETK